MIRKACAVGDLEKLRIERTPHRCFRCRSKYHLISKCPKPPKDNKKWRKQVRLSERGNRTLQKECNNGDNDNDQKIYTYMACLSDNDENPSRAFVDSSQLTDWILDSGETCHMTPQVSDLSQVH